jgi:hypothetical protein
VVAILASGTATIVSEIVTGGPGFDSNETFPTALIAFLYPFAVWRGEKRFGPALLWTFPVERRRLALARVFAGFVWLLAGLAFFVCWLLILGFLAKASPEHTVLRIPFVATIAMYLFGSAVVVGLRHPLQWIIGAAGVLFLTGTLTNVIIQPDPGRWQYIWLGAGLAALWVAASRHRERHRHSHRERDQHRDSDQHRERDRR